MFDWVPWSAVGLTGGWAVAAGIALAVLRLVYLGRLVPKSTVDMHIETIRTEREVNKELREALTQYQTVGATSVTLLEALQGKTPATEEGDSR